MAWWSSFYIYVKTVFKSQSSRLVTRNRKGAPGAWCKCAQCWRWQLCFTHSNTHLHKTFGHNVMILFENRWSFFRFTRQHNSVGSSSKRLLPRFSVSSCKRWRKEHTEVFNQCLLLQAFLLAICRSISSCKMHEIYCNSQVRNVWRMTMVF